MHQCSACLKMLPCPSTTKNRLPFLEAPSLVWRVISLWPVGQAAYFILMGQEIDLSLILNATSCAHQLDTGQMVKYTFCRSRLASQAKQLVAGKLAKWPDHLRAEKHAKPMTRFAPVRTTDAVVAGMQH
mmetsp:Transcript_109574/g.217583  ORF Transcript_109574/g.217583 Transcript_109574/m.217583 type:complete len:129 (+) Transcript_109574:65-451(+)